ncbi:MAG: ATP-grasp domain-containing protein [Acidobacteriota bacterium]|nr:ATP-grasp domain-containing protein [Acidobacteriota bacterium]
MSFSKMKIAVLYDIWDEEPPPPPEEEEPKNKKTGKRKAKKKKHKEDREEIFEALEKIGHEPFYQVLDGSKQSLFSLSRCGADLIFNLTESYAGDDTMDMNIAAYIDLIGMPYTGTGPRGLFLGQEKSVAKKLFQFHGINTPFFATSYKGMLDHSHDIKFPLIVKPTSEDGSIGIDGDSVVGSVKELMERIHYIHEEFDSPALIEEFIDGREIYAAVLGNSNPEVLPLIELDLSKLPKGTPRVAGQDVKFDRETEAYKLTKSGPIDDLDEEVIEKLTETARSAFVALRFRDYGRIDMRLNEKNEVYVIEANPNPWLASSQEYAMAAKRAGRNYTQLIEEIVNLARSRYQD